ncbi:exported hypothetical protein [Candidatus Sulfotelmatobacter sp. SbA7]|nr:exported hypothetical protein [Candidatus Sulfotelmatobacter sp. SbA7]
MKKYLWFAFVLALWNPLIAQTPTGPPDETLSPAEVKAALSGSGSKHCVTLTDDGLMFAAAISGRGELAQEPSVTILMPDAIIAMRSMFARNQFLTYEPDAEDLRRSLTIIAEGLAIGSPSGPSCSSINRVVLLSDRSSGTTAEAYASESTNETWQNGFGASSQCESLQARFSLASVHRVQALARTENSSSGCFIVILPNLESTKLRTAIWKGSDFASSQGPEQHAISPLPKQRPGQTCLPDRYTFLVTPISRCSERTRCQGKERILCSQHSAPT